jgi:hypothetical protein
MQKQNKSLTLDNPRNVPRKLHFCASFGASYPQSTPKFCGTLRIVCGTFSQPPLNAR